MYSSAFLADILGQWDRLIKEWRGRVPTSDAPVVASKGQPYLFRSYNVVFSFTFRFTRHAR